MNMVEIERALRELRLSGIAETLSTRLLQAQAAQEPFLQTFAAMLQDELDRRRSRLLERRYKRSGLDEKLTLADFDWRFNPKLPRAACFELHTLKFIGEGANALIVGKPGTGKSHLAKAVAYQATLQGYDVRYLEADTEFARYAIASIAGAHPAAQGLDRTRPADPGRSLPGPAHLRARGRSAAGHRAPALQGAPLHRRDLQPRRAGLGQISR
jgi:IstB-like ATP binding protein